MIWKCDNSLTYWNSNSNLHQSIDLGTLYRRLSMPQSWSGYYGANGREMHIKFL
jgi:hypothetical protein